MTDRQIKYLNSCKTNVRIRMLDVMRAISEGNIISITFLYDGNGACFYYLDDYAKDGKNKKLATFDKEQTDVILIGCYLDLFSFKLR